MQKRILIIHGWGSNSREHWFFEEKERMILSVSLLDLLTHTLSE